MANNNELNIIEGDKVRNLEKELEYRKWREAQYKGTYEKGKYKDDDGNPLGDDPYVQMWIDKKGKKINSEEDIYSIYGSNNFQSFRDAQDALDRVKYNKHQAKDEKVDSTFKDWSDADIEYEHSVMMCDMQGDKDMAEEVKTGEKKIVQDFSYDKDFKEFLEEKGYTSMLVDAKSDAIQQQYHAWKAMRDNEQQPEGDKLTNDAEVIPVEATNDTPRDTNETWQERTERVINSQAGYVKGTAEVVQTETGGVSGIIKDKDGNEVGKITRESEKEVNVESNNYAAWAVIANIAAEEKRVVNFANMTSEDNKARLYLACKAMGVQMKGYDPEGKDFGPYIEEMPKTAQLRLMAANKKETGVYKEQGSELDQDRTKRDRMRKVMGRSAEKFKGEYSEDMTTHAKAAHKAGKETYGKVKSALVADAVAKKEGR